jgi:hypothetical protein
MVLGNWRINGIVTAMTGTPFTVFDRNDLSVLGSAPEISGFFSNWPNLVAGQMIGFHLPVRNRQLITVLRS